MARPNPIHGLGGPIFEQSGTRPAYGAAMHRTPASHVGQISLAFILSGLSVAASGPELVATDAIPGMSVPPGTRVTVLADSKTLGVASPTALSLGERNELFVSETHRFNRGIADNRRHLYWVVDDLSSRSTADRMRMHEKWQHKEENTSLKYMTEMSEVLRVLREPDAKGVYAGQQLFADGFNGVLDGTAAGVLAYEGTVYLACIPKVHALRDTDGDGKADVRDVIQDGFGVHVSLSGHDLNGFILGPDGRIYGSMGDRGFHGTTREGRTYDLPDEGFVFRFDPDGSNFEVIHTGLRNPKELAFDDMGNLISVDNNCDHGDKARVVYVIDGGDSGWHIGHQAMLTFHNQIGLEKRPPAAWMDERLWELPNDAQPSYLLPPVAHLTSGPSGLTYHPGTGFLESEAGRFFVCDYRGGAAKSLIWSFRMEPQGAGMKMTDSYALNTGVAATDLEFSWDGRLLVTDFIGGWQSHPGGRVYAISADQPYRAKEAAEVAAMVKQGFRKQSAGELESLLSHPDQRIRIRAQLELTRRPEALEVFKKTARQAENTFARLHGIWGLGVLARRGTAALPDGKASIANPAARHEAAATLLGFASSGADAEVRAQAIKALGESGLEMPDIPFARLIADNAPRVKFFSTLAAGRMKDKSSVPALLALLENTDDRYFRLAAAHALSLIESGEELGRLATHSHPGVRMGAAIALRKQKSPELARFLTDRDPRIIDEAVRAINDLNLTQARPQIAALLDKKAPTDRSPMIWRRILQCSFRVGDEANARRVLKTALDPDVPADTRAEALRLLNLWGEATAIDQTTGRYAPMTAGDAAAARKVLSDNLSSLVGIDGILLDAALTLVRKFGIDFSSVPDDALRSLVLSPSLPGAARVDALELYSARKPADLTDIIRKLAVDADDACAIAALRLLTASDAQAALESASKTLKSPGAWRQQQSWKIIGGIGLPGAADLIAQGLDGLTKSHGVAPGALELLEQASSRKEPVVEKALAAFHAAQAASTDPLAKWLTSLEGGDAKRGGELFASHPAGQCMRCHAVGHGGGDAGPNLSDIGQRVDRRYLLEAVVMPGAKVAMGYGISTATLKSGKVVGGIVLEETKDHVDFDSAGTIMRAARADIQSMTPPVSAMPPMALILQPGEIRDIVAWLAEQKANAKRKPKRPPPVMVK